MRFILKSKSKPCKKKKNQDLICLLPENLCPNALRKSFRGCDASGALCPNSWLSSPQCTGFQTVQHSWKYTRFNARTAEAQSRLLSHPEVSPSKKKGFCQVISSGVAFGIICQSLFDHQNTPEVSSLPWLLKSRSEDTQASSEMGRLPGWFLKLTSVCF